MTSSGYTNPQKSGTVFLTLFRSERALADAAEQQQAFDAYLKARDKADATRDLMDGVAAGKCWARFLELFLPRER